MLENVVQITEYSVNTMIGEYSMNFQFIIFE